MEFHLLPLRCSDAAGNMAADVLLLQSYPQPESVRFRHYGWRRPAFTFGYSQKIESVRELLPPGGSFDITRRPTGGGLVDHRADWTYALVLGRTHSLAQGPGTATYRTVHETLAAVLREMGASIRLQQTPPDSKAGACFDRPELNDVVREADGRKVAGAALKRSNRGVLFQGSIWCPFLAEIDWTEFSGVFPHRLAETLGAAAKNSGWPEFDPEAEEALTDQFASEEWISRR